MDVLYIFKFSENDTYALDRLIASIHSLQSQNVDSVVLNGSPYCIKNKLPFSKLRYTHIPSKIDNTFNKSKYINYAMKNLLFNDYFIFSDIDMLYPNNYIESLSYYTTKPGLFRVIPWHKNVGRKIYPMNFLTATKYTTGIEGPAPGNGLFHRPSCMEIGGWDEFYDMYGPEDVDMNNRLKYINSIIELRWVKTFHLYHGTDHISRRDAVGKDKIFEEYYTNKLKHLSADTIKANIGKEVGEL